MNGDLASIAQETARLMPGWSFEYQQHSYCYLSGPDGQGLTMALDRGRLEIGGRYPRYDDGRWVSVRDFPKIGVSANRGIPAIVGEIRGRLMDEYLKALADVQAMIVKERADVVAFQGLVQALAAALGQKMPECRPPSSTHLHAGNPDLSFEVHPYGRVTMRGHLEPEEAIALAEWCRKTFPAPVEEQVEEQFEGLDFPSDRC